ncbi:MAG: monovalent cation/H(+) antiporter subunit G [Bacteroidales bacterium]|nr:monovalent cation/H(+) antiporter subunit G [Bacteroidales bacterium]MBS3775957.1 monovalent cation/H(+) antiporter subunit G [Bacteroidales bacterium]
MDILAVIGAFITLAGSIFLLLGSIGLLRMPDCYNRIQAGTKASTLGTILSFTGILLIMPGWWGKLLILIISVIITNPVSSHVLARASHHIRVPLTKATLVDKYREDEEYIPVDNKKDNNT